MYSCLHYWLFAPLRGGLEDSPERLPAFTLNVHSLDGKVYAVSLYCDQHGQPEFARFVISDLASEAIPESVLPLIQSVKEHLLSALRLTFKPDLTFAEPSSIWSFISEGAPWLVKLRIDEFDKGIYDPERTKDIFVHTFSIRELVRLYVDGLDKRIPLQYRFLSLYKILENRFRKKGHWDNEALANILEPHSSELARMGFRGKPAATLHDLRDRCAHIKTGKDILGVTHLNLNEATRVERVLPYLRAVCAVVINDRADGKFALTTDVVYDAPTRVSEIDDKQVTAVELSAANSTARPPLP